MQKRVRWWFGLLTAAAIITTGCGAGSQPPPSSAPQNESDRGPVETVPFTPLEFEVMAGSALPSELASWREVKELPQATPSARIGDFLYVLVSGGEASIGATAISVRAVELYATASPTITVKAEITPNRTGAEIATLPLTYVRIPYGAGLPVPRVSTLATLQTASGSDEPPAGAPGKGPGGAKLPVDPDRPVASPALPPPGDGTPAAPGPAPVTPIPISPAPSGNFTPIRPDQLPPALAAWASSAVQAPQGAAQYVDGALYLMAAAGQQNTGGYWVEIQACELRDGKVHVTARLHRPDPGSMVTQAITYPKAYARIDVAGDGAPQVLIDWR